MPKAPKAPFGRSASQRQPTLRGALMIDTLQGDLRVRKWPRARGKTRTKAQRKQEEWFAQVQRAANYVAPDMMLQFHEATQGTPLLPRDILTHILSGRAFMFELADGRKYYPMVFYTQVQEALDTISQTPGTFLLRTEEGWIGAEFAGGGSAWWFDPPPAERFTGLSTNVVQPVWSADEQAGLLVDFGLPSGGETVRVIMEPLDPAAPNWTYTLAMRTTMFRGRGGGIGLMVRDSSSQRDWRMKYDDRDTQSAVIQKWNALGSYNSQQERMAYSGSFSPIWLRLRRDGSSLYFEVSPNGKQWIIIRQDDWSAWFTGSADQIGIYGHCLGSFSERDRYYAAVERAALEYADA